MIDLSEYDVPGRTRGLLGLFHWRYLLGLLVRKGTSTRYRNSVLGWTWSYAKPAAQFVVYYLVIGIILGKNQDVTNFPVYLFSGLVAVNFFNEAFGNATTAVVDNKALVKKIYLPRELFPIAAIIGAFIHFLPQLTVLLIVCALIGWVPSFVAIGALLLGIVLVASFALGVGLIFAGINVRYRDAQNFVEIIRMLSTWASPVLYTWTLVAERAPDWILHIYMSNPVTIAVELFHFAFWEQTVPIGVENQPHGFPGYFGAYVGIALALCVALLVIGQLVFRRFERSFAQDL